MANITAFQKEQLDVAKKILDYKLPVEANVVSLFWKNPQLLYDYDDIDLTCFHHNEWRVYFQIIHDIVLVEEKEHIDEYVVSFYLDKHLKLKEKYEEYGGYAIPTETSKFVNEENMNGYILELQKWNVIYGMNKDNAPISNKLSKYADMTIDDIYDFEEAKLNNRFLNTVNSRLKVEDLSDGVDELIESLDKGVMVGLPYYDMQQLTKETGGCLLGDITLIGAVSGAGKSSFIRNVHLTSLIANKEPVLIMVNEESKKKWQREFIIWIANNIMHEDMQKYVLRNGKFSEDSKRVFKKCGDWLKKLKKDKILNFCSFQQYNNSNATKLIKKYASMGIKYFVLDTFKADSGTIDNNTRLQIIQNITAIYDTVKTDGGKDVHIMISCQLNSATSRYLSRDSISEAKGLINVVSTALFLRNVWLDEKEGGNMELSVYRQEGNHKVLVKLDPAKSYTLIFIGKNREGGSEGYQIVYENDLSRNTQKEIGITNVSLDKNGK